MPTLRLFDAVNRIDLAKTAIKADSYLKARCPNMSACPYMYYLTSRLISVMISSNSYSRRASGIAGSGTRGRGAERS
jgi:hypothetical protein